MAKDALRIEAYGTVDELNSLLGIVRSLAPPSQIDAVLLELQTALFVVGADLATPPPKEIRRVTPEDAALLERHIDRVEAELSPLKNFILPGGVPAAAALHHARTVCRRAERLAVRLAREAKEVRPVVVYLNRLSDLLFVLARWTNALAGVRDIPWTGKS